MPWHFCMLLCAEMLEKLYHCTAMKNTKNAKCLVHKITYVHRYIAFH